MPQRGKEVNDAVYRAGKVQAEVDRGDCCREPEGHPDRYGRRGPLSGCLRTLGRYDTVVLFEAPNEKTAMEMALRRMDRMDIETLVALPADAASPVGPESEGEGACIGPSGREGRKPAALPASHGKGRKPERPALTTGAEGANTRSGVASSSRLASSAGRMNFFCG